MNPIRPAAVAMILATGLAALIYVLSIGPAIWLTGKGVMRNSTLETTYRPLTAAAHQCRPLDNFLQWYTSKWAQHLPYIPAVPVAPTTIPAPALSSPAIPDAPLPKSLRPATAPLTALSDDSAHQ